MLGELFQANRDYGPPGLAAGIDPTLVARLEGLGYAYGRHATPRNGFVLPRPRDRLKRAPE